MRPRHLTLACAALSLSLVGCAAPSPGVAEADRPSPVPFVPTPTEGAQADPLLDFKEALRGALGASPRDYDALTALMGDSFEIMIWYGNGQQMPPAEAASALESTFLPPGSALIFDDDPDYDALIGGSPFQFYTLASDFLFARGWGSSGQDEALLTIGQQARGGYVWSGILYANDGFAANPPPPVAAEWVPLPDDVCADLAASVDGTLGAGALTLEPGAPFQDYIAGTSGTGCRVAVRGTGADFASHGEVFAQLEDMLTAQGWTRDPLYDGGGPTGTLGAFRRDSGLILVLVGWDPSPEANCPSDQPIFACGLTPEQMLYTITLSAAMQ